MNCWTGTMILTLLVVASTLFTVLLLLLPSRRDGSDPKCSVQVVVLGDIGRSPRMQYHALSIASHGGKVNLVGYVESEVHPDIQASRFITVVPITPFPKRFQSQKRLLFLLIAPLKISWQIWSLYYAL